MHKKPLNFIIYAINGQAWWGHYVPVRNESMAETLERAAPGATLLGATTEAWRARDAADAWNEERAKEEAEEASNAEAAEIESAKVFQDAVDTWAGM